METIQLPQELPEDELQTLNQRLKEGTVRLDWSNITPETSPDRLWPLLRGLRLDEHIELLNIENISEALQTAISTAFAQLAAEEDGSEEATERMPVVTLPAPEVWQGTDTPEARTEEIPEGDSTLLLDKPLLSAPPPHAIREELLDMAVRDLLGPAAGPEEEVEEARVRDRYLIGTLAPDHVQIFPEEMDDLGSLEDPSEEASDGEEVLQTRTMQPSSIGMSFCVNHNARNIQVTARWGRYQRMDSGRYTENAKPIHVWKREPRGGDVHLLPLREGAIEAWKPDGEQPDIFVKGVMHWGQHNWMVTLFLVNGQQEPKRLRDQAWIFQPELIVEAPEGNPIFQQRETEHRLPTEEMEAMAMLYRNRVSFAVGHGVSVRATTLGDDPTSAIRLETTFAPYHDVPVTEAPSLDELPAMRGLILDMRDLANAPASELGEMLRPLTRAYAVWIDEQEQRLTDPLARLEGYEQPALQALTKCRQTLARIGAGIDMLVNSQEAAQAFAFMNRAMWLQRVQSMVADENRRGGELTFQDLDTPGNRTWRVFQLAFILLNLPALTDLSHPERETDASAIADLLWFPTGGGKTEAYLGLTAYTLAIRRLQGTVEGRSGMDGVAVIMRYTLRLLTLQQFQRAAALICACEIIRRGNVPLWGETPFRLGLWVGSNSTPNTTEQSAKAIEEEKGQYNGHGTGSPRQLTHCPWCGTPIDGGKHIKVEKFNEGRGRTLFYCSSPFGECPFTQKKSPGEGLPILVVDEEIYRLLPSLLIATVDKFALLPWRGETQMLFGQVDKHCPRHGFRSPSLQDSDSHPRNSKWGLDPVRSSEHAPLRPPDLIIQDELHLISGPLGTLVGLYENAIDYLSTWEVGGKRVRPKVVAATATIRRSEDQVKSLFMRQVNIFPPQGLDIEDNFFSRQRKPSPERPGRRYLGICANGRRSKLASIRVYLSFLAAAQTLYKRYGANADPWMTLVGYFNTIKDLGGMRRLVEDDVATLLRRVSGRGLEARSSLLIEELTSRKSSNEIPKVLNLLEQPFGDPKSPRPIDILLATNMISVGVDVKRLGLMIVSGQPKTTSEYIQATSRVGRSQPGLICTIYSWNRPRDLSHYEQFEYYHATFYQQVEPISVTPFAPRALDRGLAALLTSLIRLEGSDYNANKTAGDLNTESQILRRVTDYIINRASTITDSLETTTQVRAGLETLTNYWLQRAEKINLGYQEENDDKTQGLLRQPQRGKWEPFTCLSSMRDVEPTVNLVLDTMRGINENAPGEPEESY